MKQRNPRFGGPRIAQQINLAFGLELNKDIVKRILATHYKPDPNNRGPSWLTIIGHAKDSLWSRDAGPVDLFRCESILLKSHWVMVVMDQYTRRITGFGVHAGNVDGPVLCRMFNDATFGHDWPTYLSSDNDPLFQYHRWKANLRRFDIDEYRAHSGRGGGGAPLEIPSSKVADINKYSWKKHCRGLFELPIAA